MTKKTTDKAVTSKDTAVAGGCYCGAVRYHSADAPMMVFCCHCLNCQKHSGGPFAAIVRVQRASMTVTGATQTYRYGEAGRSITKHFCPQCATRLYNEVERYPDQLYLALGTLDNPAAYVPTMQIFTRHRLPWSAHEEAMEMHD